MPDEYWNVIIAPKGDADDAVAVDKSREWIDSRILAPRSRAEPIAVDGRTFEWTDIERVRITVADVPYEVRKARLVDEDRRSHVAVFGGPSYKWRSAAAARDVTDDFIAAPPGEALGSGTSALQEPVDPQRVMVVYGRDSQARRAMFDFLRAIGLDPGEWRKLVTETNKAAPYIGEVLEQGGPLRL